MEVNELEMVARLGEVDPLAEEVLDRAEVVLRAAIAAVAVDDLTHGDLEGGHGRPSASRPRSGWLQDARRRGTRRRLVAGIAAAATLVAASVVLVSLRSDSAVQHPGTGTAPPASTAAPTAPTSPSKAQLIAKITAALENVSGDVFYVHTTSGNSSSDDYYRASGNGSVFRSLIYAPGGALVNDQVITTTGDVTSDLVIDYTDHAWWTTSNPVDPDPPPPSDCTPPSCRWVDPSGPGIEGMPLSPSAFQAQLRQDIDASVTVVPGTQVVDGVQTTEITEDLGDGSTRSYWVDQATDLPVRLVTSGDSLPGNNSQEDMSWLPPTAANLALLHASVPAGFTHAAEPITPPAPAGGGVG